MANKNKVLTGCYPSNSEFSCHNISYSILPDKETKKVQSFISKNDGGEVQFTYRKELQQAKRPNYSTHNPIAPTPLCIQ